ncbi:MAG: hypothetical protein HXY47_04275 [Nitrospirae bacterium]|nr:hypothetical protein [Nitrospirota bacterium]
MATDAVLIPEGEEIITVACTSIGTDTVMVIKSGASNKFLEIKDLKFLIKTMCYTLIIKVNYE